MPPAETPTVHSFQTHHPIVMRVSTQRSEPVPDTGDTAWMLASSALVLLMTPGLAFFYGGMVRSKSVLNMIMMSMSAMGIVGVLWVLYGYS